MKWACVSFWPVVWAQLHHRLNHCFFCSCAHHHFVGGEKGLISRGMGIIEPEAIKWNFKALYFCEKTKMHIYGCRDEARLVLDMGWLSWHRIHQERSTNSFTDLHQNILAHFPTNDNKYKPDGEQNSGRRLTVPRHKNVAKKLLIIEIYHQECQNTVSVQKEKRQIGTICSWHQSLNSTSVTQMQTTKISSRRPERAVFLGVILELQPWQAENVIEIHLDSIWIIMTVGNLLNPQ